MLTKPVKVQTNLEFFYVPSLLLLPEPVGQPAGSRTRPGRIFHTKNAGVKSTKTNLCIISSYSNGVLNTVHNFSCLACISP